MGRKKQSTGNTSHDEADHQHFSHPHSLKLVNISAETLTSCNACEQPNNTNKPFYGCNSCQYFLHENCFNAPRFLNHQAHSSHPLTLHPIPPYSTRSYNCKACGSIGNGFSFSCARCEFDLHLHCASCPTEILLSDKHPHQLEIFDGSFEDEDTIFICDICDVKMNKGTWLYYCARCDFGSHLQCAISPEVGVFPRQQQQQRQNHQQKNPNPNPNPSPNSNTSTNSAVEMINEANEAHDRLIAAQLECRINAHTRAAILDLWD